MALNINSDLAKVDDVTYFYLAPITNSDYQVDGSFSATHRLILTDRNYQDFREKKITKFKQSFLAISAKLVDVLLKNSIIFLSSEIHPEDLEEFITASADDILEKMQTIKAEINEYNNFNRADNKLISYVLFNIKTTVNCSYSNERIKELSIRLEPTRRAIFNANGWTPGFKHMYYRFKRISKSSISKL